MQWQDIIAMAQDLGARSPPEWSCVYQALAGDCSDRRLQGDYSGYPQAIRDLAAAFLDLHRQRLLADEAL